MKSSGVDELYIVARTVLLDALAAMGPHRDACVLVGAQAIYLRVGDADLAVAPYTTDGDLVLDPRILANAPPLQSGLTKAGFVLRGEGSVGIWIVHRATRDNPDVEIAVDMLVPEGVSDRMGRRAARLGGHERNAARIARGLEGALIDADIQRVEALDERDGRFFEIRIAGPGALLVSKLHKIRDRAQSKRAKDKDAYDVLRLLRGTTTDAMVGRLRALLADPISAAVTRESQALLDEFFGTPGSTGSQMAGRASQDLADAAEVAASCTALAQDLLRRLKP